MKYLLVLLLLSLLSINALGTILEVPIQLNSIQSAITAADNFDTVKVYPGNYYERLFITRPLSLFGLYPFENDTSVISQTRIILPALPSTDDSTSILIVRNVESLNINGLSFYEGRGSYTDGIKFGGAINADSSELIIKNSVFKNNSANGAGAVLLKNCETIIYNCTFDSNHVDSSSGGAIIAVDGNRFIVKKSIFTNNWSGDFVGAVRAQINQNAPCIIDSCVFINNFSNALAGAVLTNGNQITRSYFANNSALIGGAIYLNTSGNPLSFNVSDNVFVNNSVFNDSIYGGGLGSAMAIQGSAISFPVNLTHNIFINNQANSSRGTIYQQSGNVFLKNNHFINNSAVNGSVYYANINAKTFLDSNVFIQNRANYGTFRLSQSCTVYAHYNDFYQNGNWLLSLGGGSHYVVADNNYWGHPSGPWAVSNPNGQGDSVNTGVLYIPFRTTPVFPELPVRDFGDYGDGSERGQNGSGMPNTITIEKVYPNPTNSTLTVHYSLNRPQLISIRLYDTNGREVYTSLPQPIVAGSHTFSLQTDGIASGLYLLKLSSPTSPTESAMQKVVLLK